MTAGLVWVQAATKASQTSQVARPNLAHGFRMPRHMVRQLSRGRYREIVPDFRELSEKRACAAWRNGIEHEHAPSASVHQWPARFGQTILFAVMRIRIFLLSLGGIALLVGIMLLGGRFLFRGLFQMQATKRRFDALVKTNDHRAVAEAALATIRTYTNAEFRFDQVTNLAPVIASLRPNSVVVYPDSVTIEFAGGFDHFGFKVENQDEAWEMSWYTEQGRHPLLTLPEQEGNGESARKKAPPQGSR